MEDRRDDQDNQDRRAHMFQEQRTWRLLETIYKYRKDGNAAAGADGADGVDGAGGAGGAGAEQESTCRKYDQGIVDDIFNDKPDIRVKMLVIEWLEESAETIYRGSDLTDANEAVILNTVEKELMVVMDGGGDGDGDGGVGSRGWDATARELGLKQQKGNTSAKMLDPDAPLREKSKHSLAKENAAGDEKLMQWVWKLLRMGLKTEAIELCRRRGQRWRAAMLDGWKLYNDPAITAAMSDEDEDNRGYEATGNWHRSLWKENAFAIANDTEFGDHERAVFATLSGNLQQMATVCKTWEDMLWAYYTVMVDYEIDAAIESQVRAEETNPLIICRREYTVGDSSLRNVEGGNLTPQIILNDKLMEEGLLQDGAQEPLHIVQKYIILGDMQSLVKKMREIIDDLTARAFYGFQRTECLRIFAEIVIALYDLDDIAEAVNDDAAHIVHEYVKDLIEMEVIPDRVGERKQRQTGIVAFYTSVLMYFLPEDSAEPVERYAEFLKQVTDPEERKQCFNFAHAHGLDTAAITKRAVELTRGEVLMEWELELDETAGASDGGASDGGGGAAASSPTNYVSAASAAASAALALSTPGGASGAAGDSMVEGEGYEGDEDTAVSELDREKIEAIELLLYDEQQRSEALKQSNFVMREFMIARKRSAVRLVLEKIPEGSIELIEQQSGVVQADGFLVVSTETRNIIREFDSITVWCEALELYEDWDFWHTERRPTPPDHDAAPAVGRGAAARSHEQRDYTEKLGRWQDRLDAKFEDARIALLAVLQFEDGWLMPEADTEADGDEDGADLPVDERLMYIPELCECYHQVLHEQGKFKECLEIADIIACPFDGTHLHDVYKQPDNIPHLQELLRRIAGSARCIIEKTPNADTLGY